MKQLVRACLLLMVSLLCSSCTKVRDGERVVCKVGEHVIREDIIERDVPFWEASKYSIRTTSIFCQPHGDEQVSYRIIHRCRTCKKAISEEAGTAARKLEQADQTLDDSEHPECAQQRESAERRDRIYRGARSASQKVGEFLGNVGKGLFDGANQGSR